MDKQVFIDKIALISEELQIIATNWIRKDYQIDALEVETYLSNLRYLAEQASILRELLEEQSSENDLHLHISNIPNKKNTVVNEPVISENTETNIPSFKTAESSADEFAAELSLHEKLSEQMKESSLADSLKSSFLKKDLNLSLNERFFFINDLFNGDQRDFDKVMQHLTTLDSWEEVEFYLNATCVIPYSWNEKENQRNQFYELLQKRFN